MLQRCCITERIASNGCYRIWNGNGSKFRLRKCPRSNGLQARWQRYICQIRSRSKRIRCDFCNRIWYGIGCSRFCRRIAEQRCLFGIQQHIIFNRKCSVSIFNRKRQQADAISKYIFSQCCQGCWNGNALQRYTVEKSKVADALQRLRRWDIAQGNTIRKGRTSDGLQGVHCSDASQRGAGRKGIWSNYLHVSATCYRFQTLATIKSTLCNYSHWQTADGGRNFNGRTGLVAVNDFCIITVFQIFQALIKIRFLCCCYRQGNLRENR